MERIEEARVRVGDVVRRREMGAARDGDAVVCKSVPGGLFAVEGFGRDLTTYQEHVCLRGLDGPDRGVLFFGSLHAFALRFRPEPPPQAAVEERDRPPATEGV